MTDFANDEIMTMLLAAIKELKKSIADPEFLKQTAAFQNNFVKFIHKLENKRQQLELIELSELQADLRSDNA